MRLIADLVLNHTSDQHPWFQSARSSRTSPYRDYYCGATGSQKYQGTRIIFLDFRSFQLDLGRTGRAVFLAPVFTPLQPDLNYDNPAVQA